MQDRRLHLDEAALVEEPAQAADELRPPAERLAHLRVDRQIHVALAVPCLDVGESVPLLRQRAKRLGEQAEAVLVSLDRQLARLGAHRAAAHPGDVSQVEQLQRFVRGVAHLVLLDECLQVARPVAQGEEGHLPHRADGHHAARDRVRGGVVVLQRLGGVGAVDFPHVLGRRADLDVVAVGVLPARAQIPRFLLAQPDLVLDRAGRAGCRLLGHRIGGSIAQTAAVSRGSALRKVG